MTKETSVRLGNMFRFFSRIYQFPRIRRSVAASFVAVLFNKFPHAQEITIEADEYRLPGIEEFKSMRPFTKRGLPRYFWKGPQLKLPLVTPVTAAKSLAVFRIALGLLMLAELATTAPSLTELYGPHGFLQANLMDQITGGSSLPLSNPATRMGMTYDEILMLIFGLQGVALAFFTIGRFTRVATVMAWIGQTFFMNSSVLAVYGVDRYFHAFIFLSLFLPLSAVWSVDSLDQSRGKLRKQVAAAPIGLLVLQITLLITYLHAGISKMGGHDCWSGDAIWRAVNLPEFSQWNLLWMARIPWLAKVLCWGTLVIETGYVAAVWFKKLRMPWVLAILSLRLGIAVFMGLYLFALSLMLLNVTLFLLPEILATKQKVIPALRESIQQGFQTFPKKGDVSSAS